MINLEKGQRISMDKGLTLVGVGLGWDPNEGTGYVRLGRISIYAWRKRKDTD